MSPLVLWCALAAATPGPVDAMGLEIPAREAVPFSVTASTTKTSSAAQLWRVLVAPTWGAASAGQPEPTEDMRRTFSRYVLRAARRGFEARNMRLLSTEAADAALTIAGSGQPCRAAPCFPRAARAAGATHWLASLLLREAGRCSARVVLFDVRRRQPARRVDDRAPCDAEGVLALGAALGRRIAEGAPMSRPATLALTPNDVPELNIADIPDLFATRVATSSRAERSLDYGQALEIYERRHLVAFEQDGDLFLSKRGRLLTECEAWKEAWVAHHAPLDVPRGLQVPLPKPLKDHCSGNAWEWAWLGVPAGAVIAWGSWGDLTRGELGGVTGFTLGLISAAVGAGLALSLDEDAVEPEDARYLGSRTEVLALVAAANAALRRKLELSDADVLMAGMRL